MQFISIKREQSVAQSPTLKSQEDRISQHNSHRLRLFEQHRLSDLSVSVWEMAAGPGSATVERFIVGAQKSANQLKVVLAKLLPGAGLGARAGAGSPGSAVEALLSDITDSLSQALASLRLGALDTQRSPWQSSTGAAEAAAGGGGRRSAPRRSGQRVRYLPLICSRSSIIFQLIDYVVFLVIRPLFNLDCIKFNSEKIHRRAVLFLDALRFILVWSNFSELGHQLWCS